MRWLPQKTIEAVCAAFGRGHVPFIRERTTEHTLWDLSVGQPEVPWHVTVRSRAELPRFFEPMADNVAFEAFEPRAFLVDGRRGVVRLHVAYEVKRTGRRVDEEQVQWWTFDDAGRISALRHSQDTAAVRDDWGAWRGGPGRDRDAGPRKA